jgi:hypothetical protein
MVAADLSAFLVVSVPSMLLLGIRQAVDVDTETKNSMQENIEII